MRCVCESVSVWCVCVRVCGHRCWYWWRSAYAVRFGSSSCLITSRSGTWNLVTSYSSSASGILDVHHLHPHHAAQRFVPSTLGENTSFCVGSCACVVGGGAAGYFAAIQAAQSLREVCGGRQSLLVPYVGIHLSNTPLLVPLYSVAWRIIR